MNNAGGPPPVWLRFVGHIKSKGLMGFVLASFSDAVSILKDLVGSFWLRFGFVLKVMLLILKHMIGFV